MGTGARPWVSKSMQRNSVNLSVTDIQNIDYTTIYIKNSRLKLWVDFFGGVTVLPPLSVFLCPSQGPLNG